MDEVELLLERGKVMQLHGLSNAQWNGSIVSIDARSVDIEGETKFVCEVIFGDNKGKKLKVKETNLMEIPRLPIKQLNRMKELSKLRKEFDEACDSPRGSKKRESIKNIYEKLKDMSAIVPNCCMIWDSLAKIGKLNPLLFVISHDSLLLTTFLLLLQRILAILLAMKAQSICNMYNALRRILSSSVKQATLVRCI